MIPFPECPVCGGEMVENEAAKLDGILHPDAAGSGKAE